MVIRGKMKTQKNVYMYLYGHVQKVWYEWFILFTKTLFLRLFLPRILFLCTFSFIAKCPHQSNISKSYFEWNMEIMQPSCILSKIICRDTKFGDSTFFFLPFVYILFLYSIMSYGSVKTGWYFCFIEPLIKYLFSLILKMMLHRKMVQRFRLSWEHLVISWDKNVHQIYQSKCSYERRDDR